MPVNAWMFVMSHAVPSNVKLWSACFQGLLISESKQQYNGW
jgi:hypothetical protein